MTLSSEKVPMTLFTPCFLPNLFMGSPARTARWCSRVARGPSTAAEGQARSCVGGGDVGETQSNDIPHFATTTALIILQDCSNGHAGFPGMAGCANVRGDVGTGSIIKCRRSYRKKSIRFQYMKVWPVFQTGAGAQMNGSRTTPEKQVGGFSAVVPFTVVPAQASSS